MSKARVVHKFAVPLGERFTIDIPYGMVVGFDQQAPEGSFGPGAKDMFMWVEYQPGWPSDARTFEVFGTGQPIPDECQHVRTALVRPFVWHLYEYM